MNYFNVFEGKQQLVIQLVPSLSFSGIKIFIDGQAVTPLVRGKTLILPTRKLPGGTHLLQIAGVINYFGCLYPVEETYHFTIQKRGLPHARGVNYKPGDILVASDNSKGVPPGYIGHAAILINKEQILESDIGQESIAVNPVAKFFEEHDWYAHYRPKDEAMGIAAVDWGLKYYRKYKKNIAKGKSIPVFSYIPASKFKDTQTTIYCSKLVWFCYYYGAGYEFERRGIWFPPQKLDDELKKDGNFELVYKHPDHSYKIKLG